MLRRYATVFFMIFSIISPGAVARGQSQQEKIDIEAIAKIKDEEMKHSQVMDILSYLTDVSGPRLTNSPNIRAAQEWAKGKLAAWGLQNARLEAWGPFGRGWSLEGFAVNMVKPHYSPLIAYAKAWSPSTNGTMRGEVVYLKAKSADELEKYKGKLKGAIVLIDGQRAVKAHFDAEGRRMSDDDLLKLANADAPKGGASRNRPELTAEQKAAAELLLKKWQMVVAEGAGVVLEPGRGDGGTIFIGSATVPAPVDARKRQAASRVGERHWHSDPASSRSRRALQSLDSHVRARRARRDGSEHQHALLRSRLDEPQRHRRDTGH